MSHTHSANCGCAEEHREVDSRDEFSLFAHIDTPRVRCLNHAAGHGPEACLLPHSRRGQREAWLESDADEQLILFIPCVRQGKNQLYSAFIGLVCLGGAGARLRLRWAFFIFWGLAFVLYRRAAHRLHSVRAPKQESALFGFHRLGLFGEDGTCDVIINLVCLGGAGARLRLRVGFFFFFFASVCFVLARVV
jgi:hypothetical protein